GSHHPHGAGGNHIFEIFARAFFIQGFLDQRHVKQFGRKEQTADQRFFSERGGVDGDPEEQGNRRFFDGDPAGGNVFKQTHSPGNQYADKTDDGKHVHLFAGDEIVNPVNQRQRQGGHQYGGR